MAEWEATRHDASEINNGEKYEVDDNVSLEELNSIVENSLYAMDTADHTVVDYTEIAEGVGGVNPLDNYYTKGETQNLISNPNLLINGDFRVNQRGGASYTGSGNRLYTVDRWAITSSASVTSINSNSVSVSFLTQYQAFEQKIEDYGKLKGKTVTLSCKISNVAISSSNQLYLRYNSGDTNGTKQITGDGTYSLTFTVSNSATLLAVQIFSGSGSGITYSFDLEWMKLELGSIATPFSPRPYAEELAMCQRYYVKYTQSSTRFPANTVTTTQARVIIILPVPLRTVPTITAPNYTSGNLTYGGAVHDLVAPAPNHYVLDNNIETLTVTTTNITYANTGMCNFGGNLEFDAEIY